MCNFEQLNNSKLPIIVFDKKLEQFRNKSLFPEKLAKANTYHHIFNRSINGEKVSFEEKNYF
jgi:hypothetical protein